jgi:hypothetical protein
MDMHNKWERETDRKTSKFERFQWWGEKSNQKHWKMVTYKICTISVSWTPFLFFSWGEIKIKVGIGNVQLCICLCLGYSSWVVVISYVILKNWESIGRVETLNQTEVGKNSF